MPFIIHADANHVRDVTQQQPAQLSTKNVTVSKLCQCTKCII